MRYHIGFVCTRYRLAAALVIALLLIQKIASLFMIMAVGFALVRMGILKTEQSAVFSKILLYGVCPCACIAALVVSRMLV